MVCVLEVEVVNSRNSNSCSGSSSSFFSAFEASVDSSWRCLIFAFLLDRPSSIAGSADSPKSRSHMKVDGFAIAVGDCSVGKVSGEKRAARETL